ncbi:MAG: hypothetical protein LBT37_06400 [Lactobacillaceae bacterium]|jgi:hypothetical protein|nr:hypothetical protein [Lactobacillaceae bacterium]
MTKYKVSTKWGTDSGFTMIYYVIGIDPSRNILFYNIKLDPKWKPCQELTVSEILATKCYKQSRYTQDLKNIPDDAYMYIC